MMFYRFSLLAGLVLLAGCTPSKPAETASARKGRIVLVHGAWSDARAWDRVTPLLTEQGYDVTAVNLPGHGTDNTPADSLSLARYVTAVEQAIGSDTAVILVGHSFGGIVISQVAEHKATQLKRLVYVAAYLPRNGESLYQLSQTDSASHVGKYWHQDAPQQYSPASLRPDAGIVDVFCADCDSSDQAMLVRNFKAEAVPPMATPVNLTDSAFGRVPKVYVETTQDHAVSHVLQQRMLATTPVQQRHVLNTGHSPYLTKPRELAQMIVQ